MDRQIQIRNKHKLITAMTDVFICDGVIFGEALLRHGVTDCITGATISEPMHAETVRVMRQLTGHQRCRDDYIRIGNASKYAALNLYKAAELQTRLHQWFDYDTIEISSAILAGTYAYNDGMTDPNSVLTSLYQTSDASEDVIADYLRCLTAANNATKVLTDRGGIVTPKQRARLEEWWDV